MSNAFKSNILKIIDDQIEFKRSSYTAYVIDYNHKKKTIDVKLSGYVHGQTDKENEYKEKFANPYRAAEKGYIDDIIEPAQTRFRLIRSLEMLATKRDSNPPRKHGNIPL